MHFRVYSIACLAPVDALVASPTSPEDEAARSPITGGRDVSLSIIPTGRERGFFPALFELLGKLKRSRYQLNSVKIDFLETSFPDEAAIRGATQLCRLVLRDISRFDVTLCIPPTISTVISTEAWGEFFQSVCRVDCDDTTHTSTDEDEDVTQADGDNCNSLDLLFVRGSDARLVVMFWSALAFSNGYEYISLADYQEKDWTREILQVCYSTLAFISKFNGIKRFHWRHRDLESHFIGTMSEIHNTSLKANGVLTRVLSSWYKEWQYHAKDANAVTPLETLDHTIVMKYGFVLHDDGVSGWLDVFVPGYAQCRVDRGLWEQLDVPSNSNLLQLAAQPQLERICLEPQSIDMNDGWNLGQIFRVIGASLVKIDIQKSCYDFDLTRICGAGLLSILASCPRLRHLTVNGFKPPEEHLDIDTSQIAATGLRWLSIRMESELDRTTLDTIPNRSPAFDALFAELLPAIGSHLEHFEMRKMDAKMPFAQAFRALMVSCPNLNYVALRGMNIESLAPIVDAYREARTKLTTLRLDHCVMMSESLDHFISFLAKPRDNSSSAELHTLHIRFSQHRQLYDLTLSAFLAMLAVNETLRVLTLEMPSAFVNAEPFTPIVSEFDSFSGQWLSFQEAPVDLRSKSALLSVLAAKNVPTEAEIGRLVFDFAAKRTKRDCSVSFY